MHIATWTTFILLLGASTCSNGQSSAALDWVRANEATIRLSPAAFPSLTASIRRELERRGCSIPQSYDINTAHNIVRGRFTTSTQDDVAVLCSRKRVSTILVFRGGLSTNIAEFASEPDINYLQVIGPDGAIGFSRMLGIAGQKYILKNHESFGGPKPPPLDHQGIDDAFLDKASTVWYWHGRRWKQLNGVD